MRIKPKVNIKSKSKSKLKVLVLLHADLVPPEVVESKDLLSADWKMEYYIIQALKKLKHEVFLAPLRDDLSIIRKLNFEVKPDMAFNLIEEFDGEAIYDANIVSYLELIKLKYSGCNPRGLILSRDKALTKKILSYHRIPVPKFQVIKKSKRGIRLAKNMKYPLFVKSLSEEASLGISQASLVFDEKDLVERVAFIHNNINTDAIVEEFIEGREIYVSVMGNNRLVCLPPTELVFSKSKDPEMEFATRKVKWDEKYRESRGISSNVCENLSASDLAVINKVAKKTFKALNLSAYARIDIRFKDGVPYVIEANPNPSISPDDDFCIAAKKYGLSYQAFIQKILDLALKARI